ncbi:hypothetical protein [Streptomyces indicus]|uniref:PknH-like extracellular domain-containing protein n=1 Tax=Streptomyces indicus TaxID=417292 RepID=A0A1G9EDM1_9ACTN|nr:hypothetical protein [Streptomyces indicus]SDK74151.1 hypothetical protein SAMN05421806_11195 [Streptomyces indicus]
MKKSKLSQVVVAAAAVAALGLTAACSGDSGSDGGDKSGKGKSSAGQEGGGADKAAPALTEAQLKKAILGNDEVKGYKLEDVPDAEIPKESEKVPGECQVLSDVLTTTTQPAPKARAIKAGMAGQMESMASIALAAHEQADAEKLVADVREAVDACKGFKDSDGAQSTVQGQPDPKLGDESVAYVLVSGEGDEQSKIAFNVVRSGSTLATFYSMNISAEGDSKVPAELVDAQIKKLESVK